MDFYKSIIYMAGRSRKVRNIQSYINHIDNNTFSGPMKSGTAPSIGKTQNHWHNYIVRCNQNPNQVKKSYANMVFLNINSAKTPVSAGFRPTTNYNYSYNAPTGVKFYDANLKYNNHYYRPYNHEAIINTQRILISKHMTGFVSKIN
jgi:hypothetical protein